jgi:hypothetical protein
MKNQFFILAIFISSTFACSNDTKQPAESVNPAKVESNDINQKYADSLVQYVTLKNSLVQSDPAATSIAAKALEQSLQDEALITLVKAIGATDNLESQREFFSELSDHFINTLKTADIGSKLYVQYCPMAFDNAGASWLSLSEEIENPYFGDQMLHCGTVDEVLE